MGKPPLPAFVLQLQEARAEWRKRHPPTVLPDSWIVSPGTQVSDLPTNQDLKRTVGRNQSTFPF